MGSPFTQSGWVIERNDLPHGNFELMFACPADVGGGSALTGLDHWWWDNGGLSDPTMSPDLWQHAETITNPALPGSWRGATLLMSTYGDLESVATHEDGRVAHFALVGIWGWQGPAFLPGPAAGPPAFIQSRFGRQGNFEVIAPRPGGGLSHFFRDNDHGEIWHEAPQPSPRGAWSGVGLIHSSYGNLEVVGVMDGDLVFLFQGGAGGTWSTPQVIAHGFRGRPGFIQGPYGGRGNFEAVGATGDGLAHFWRNNDDPALPWVGPYPFAIDDPFDTGGRHVFADVTLFHSSFGQLEVHARDAGGTTVAWFRAAPSVPWTEPQPEFAIPCEFA